MRTSKPVAPVLQGASHISTAPYSQYDYHHYRDDEVLHHETHESSASDDAIGFWPHEEYEDENSESETSTSFCAAPAPPQNRRIPLRPRSSSRQPPYRPARHSPDTTPSVAYQDEYGGYGPSHAGGQYNRGNFSGGAPHQHQQQAFAPPYYHHNQMVGFHANPFSPMSNASSNSSFFPDQRAQFGTEMVHQFHPQFYQSHGLVGFPVGHPAAPAAPAAPANSENDTREKEIKEMEAKIAAFEKEKREKEQAELQKKFEAEALEKAAMESQKYIEQMERLKEQNILEIARARTEAERTARENIEAERKAAEDRARQRDEAIKAAEERVRIEYENQRRAHEAQQKKEAEDRMRAEEAAELRLQAALRADAEMKEAQAKKAAEEAAKLEQIREEAKRKADAEMEAKIKAEKEAAEKKAQDEALAAQEREAYKKKIEEETKASLEAQAKKDKGPYLQFKDALSRKYSFPYRLCTTWPDMEELIKQAFDSLDELGVQVQEGWYDLIGPSGEIILPSVWEKVVEPEWSITMTMWPLERIRGSANQAGANRSHGVPPVPPPVGSGDRPPVWPDPHGNHTKGAPHRSNTKPPRKKKQPDLFASFFTGKSSRRKPSKK